MILQELFSTLLQASEKSWQVPRAAGGDSCRGWGRFCRGGTRLVPAARAPTGLAGFPGAQLSRCPASGLCRLGEVSGTAHSAVTHTQDIVQDPPPASSRVPCLSPRHHLSFSGRLNTNSEVRGSLCLLCLKSFPFVPQQIVTKCTLLSDQQEV